MNNKGIHLLNIIIMCNDLKVLDTNCLWIQYVMICYDRLKQRIKNWIKFVNTMY